MPNTTLRDVARRAGVSYQTVSRVINNQGYVANDTRKRILEIIAELDYHPNRAARTLASRYSQTLALITFGLDYYGPTQMVVNIERAAKAAGYDLMFSNVSSGKEMQAAMTGIRRWQVDGILLITPVLELMDENLAPVSGDIPVVQINGLLGTNHPSVVVEQRYGSRLATKHLIELGHQRIAEISGPLNWFDALERHESWTATMKEAGLEPVLSIEGDWTTASGYQTARHLLQRGAKFTALVVGNDQMALGAMAALREKGFRIPEDVSIVGFDDIPEAAYFSTPLTTVRQNFNALGRLGIEVLVERIQNLNQSFTQQVIYPELVRRASTASPRV